MTSGPARSPAGDDRRWGQEAVDEEDDEDDVLAEPVEADDEPESPEDPLEEEPLDAPEPAEPEPAELDLLVALVALLDDRESVL